jgi:hypothetical protein
MIPSRVRSTKIPGASRMASDPGGRRSTLPRSAKGEAGAATVGSTGSSALRAAIVNAEPATTIAAPVVRTRAVRRVISE